MRKDSTRPRVASSYQRLAGEGEVKDLLVLAVRITARSQEFRLGS